MTIIGVATKAAEIQIEQTDIALANTFRFIGRKRKQEKDGATALAQAAARGKQGVAASIERKKRKTKNLGRREKRSLINKNG